MSRKTKFIMGVSLVAQAFTCFVLSFVYSGKKKGLSKTFLGCGIAGGLAGAYLLFCEYKTAASEKKKVFDNWCSDDCCCCDGDDLFDEESGDADDINLSISNGDSYEGSDNTNIESENDE